MGKRVAGGMAWGRVDSDWAQAREQLRKAPELRRRYAIVDAALAAQSPWIAFDPAHPVGRVHEVGLGMALCVFELAAVTGLSLRKVRARIRGGLTGRALVEVDGRDPFDLTPRGRLSRPARGAPVVMLLCCWPAEGALHSAMVPMPA